MNEMPDQNINVAEILRDYFAGQALTGLLITGFVDNETTNAYELADAMMKARENMPGYILPGGRRA